MEGSDMPDLTDPRPDAWDDDDAFDDEHEDFVSLKYLFEGATTLAALSTELRRVADHFDEQTAAGWRLASPVENGHVHLVRDAV